MQTVVLSGSGDWKGPFIASEGEVFEVDFPMAKAGCKARVGFPDPPGGMAGGVYVTWSLDGSPPKRQWCKASWTPYTPLSKGEHTLECSYDQNDPVTKQPIPVETPVAFTLQIDFPRK